MIKQHIIITCNKIFFIKSPKTKVNKTQNIMKLNAHKLFVLSQLFKHNIAAIRFIAKNIQVCISLVPADQYDLLDYLGHKEKD